MEFDRALRVFRLYCEHRERDPIQAESLLLTDEEKQVILEMKEVIGQYGSLFTEGGRAARKRAA